MNQTKGISNNQRACARGATRKRSRSLCTVNSRPRDGAREEKETKWSTSKEGVGNIDHATHRQ